jgi:MinD-like ATPase involved in chromosome partitioning or flagellar assembly
VKKGEYAFRVIAGEGVLVPIRGGVGDLHSIFTMNEVGAAIWGFLAPERTTEDIIRHVCDEFEVSREQAAKDVAEFLQMLREKGLVEPAPAVEAGSGMP